MVLVHILAAAACLRFLLLDLQRRVLVEAREFELNLLLDASNHWLDRLWYLQQLSALPRCLDQNFLRVFKRAEAFN